MLVTVSRTTNAIDANIIRGRLAAEGIQASVAFEHHIWAEWINSLAMGGVRVQVPPSQGSAAVAALDRIRSGYYESLLFEEFPTDDRHCCPKCRSADVENERWPAFVTVLSWMFIPAVLAPFTKHLMHCRNCTNRWIDHEQRGIPFSVTASIVFTTMAALIVAAISSGLTGDYFVIFYGASFLAFLAWIYIDHR